MRFRDPFSVVIVGGTDPPVQKTVQGLDVFFDIGTQVLFRITVYRYKMIIIFFELDPVNAESRPAAVRPKDRSLHVPEPLVLHFLRDIPKAERFHFLIAYRPVKHKSLMLFGYRLGFPVFATGCPYFFFVLFFHIFHSSDSS